MLLLLACAADPTDSKDPRDTADTNTPPTEAGPRPVPAPTSLVVGEGTWTLDATTTIGADGDAVPVAEALATTLRASTGLPLPIATTGAVQLTLVDGLPAEAYHLDVTGSGATLAASDAAGLFYAAQTLLQLAPPEVYSPDVVDADWTLPAVTIEDAPRYAWRGMMIDVARHFFTVADVERQIDLMAAHKLNRLHLHLTDDQGWRIEIKSWPDLTTIGGSTEVGGGPGGFYTQEELLGLIDYAAARHITLIPEIDFPAHTQAALASYGELNEGGEPLDLYTGTGVIATPLWLDGPMTLPFVEDVWSEMAALSPSTILHIGGDEAIDISAADYASFLTWLQGDLRDEGRTLLGWDEIGAVDLGAPFYAQYWYDPTNTRDAVSHGAQVIASPAEHAYLDMMQSSDAEYGQIWAGIVDTQDSYDWDPVLTGLEDEDVIGVEGCLWTEYIDDPTKLDFMLWPRMAALAEVGWSEERDWREFRGRLAWHGQRLDTLGVGFYADPGVDWE